LAKSADDGGSLAALLKCGNLVDAEAEIDGYAMLAELDFAHPVLAPFFDVRFADFTKIHVWRHRRLKLDAIADCRVLARFDNGDPALFEKQMGAGRVLVFAAGWHPADSQLALSTKFVPLLNGILDYATASRLHSPATGDIVQSVHASPVDDDEESLMHAEGRTSKFGPSAGHTSAAAWSEPGTSLSPDESKTSLLPVEKLESLGVRMAAAMDGRAISPTVEHRRQLLTQECEQWQKLWRWLIVAAIAVLIL
jgi:hypothetical protein